MTCNNADTHETANTTGQRDSSGRESNIYGRRGVGAVNAEDVSDAARKAVEDGSDGNAGSDEDDPLPIPTDGAAGIIIMVDPAMGHDTTYELS